MTEKFQKFEMTEEMIEEFKKGLLKDPDMEDVEYKDGEFIVKTKKGTSSFKLEFVKEKLSGNA